MRFLISTPARAILWGFAVCTLSLSAQAQEYAAPVPSAPVPGYEYGAQQSVLGGTSNCETCQSGCNQCDTGCDSCCESEKRGCSRCRMGGHHICKLKGCLGCKKCQSSASQGDRIIRLRSTGCGCDDSCGENCASCQSGSCDSCGSYDQCAGCKSCASNRGLRILKPDPIQPGPATGLSWLSKGPACKDGSCGGCDTCRSGLRDRVAGNARSAGYQRSRGGLLSGGSNGGCDACGDQACDGCNSGVGYSMGSGTGCDVCGDAACDGCNNGAGGGLLSSLFGNGRGAGVGNGGGLRNGYGVGNGGGLGNRVGSIGCGRSGCGAGGNLCNECRGPGIGGLRNGGIGGVRGGGIAGLRGEIPHTAQPPHGAMGPGAQAPTYAYPYYTTRAPRDFLMDNPPTIGW